MQLGYMALNILSGKLLNCLTVQPDRRMKFTKI